MGLTKVALGIEIFCAIVGGMCGVACMILPVNHPTGLIFLALGSLCALLMTGLCGWLVFWVVVRALEGATWQ